MEDDERPLPQALDHGYVHKKELFLGQEVYVNRVDFRKPVTPHAHDFIEVAFVAGGVAIHRTEGMEERVARGDLVLINTDISHSFEPLPESSDSVRVYNCTFVPGFFDFSLLNSRGFADVTRHFLFHSFLGRDVSGHSRASLDEASIPRVEALFENMLREYVAREDGWIEMVRAGTIELLIHYLRALRRGGLGEARPDDGKDRWFREAVDYIERNYSRTIRLEDLSMMAFLSPTYFCARFREYTGSTFTGFVQRTRIEAAARLLRTTDRKVADVAEEVGYRDLRNFNRLFRRLLGCSPSEFRRTQSPFGIRSIARE
jgi:AraC-like DNA-binding protein